MTAALEWGERLTARPGRTLLPAMQGTHFTGRCVGFIYYLFSLNAGFKTNMLLIFGFV